MADCVYITLKVLVKGQVTACLYFQEKEMGFRLAHEYGNAKGIWFVGALD